MKGKAEENLSAARLLIGGNMFSSSVHSSYYAGFQFSKHVLANFCGLSYERQEKESKGKDSNHYIEYKMADELDKKNHTYYTDYLYYYDKMKMLRKKADYSNKDISDKEASRAYYCADKIITFLKTKYSIL